MKKSQTRAKSLNIIKLGPKVKQSNTIFQRKEQKTIYKERTPRLFVSLREKNTKNPQINDTKWRCPDFCNQLIYRKVDYGQTYLQTESLHKQRLQLKKQASDLLENTGRSTKASYDQEWQEPQTPLTPINKILRLDSDIKQMSKNSKINCFRNRKRKLNLFSDIKQMSKNSKINCFRNRKRKLNLFSDLKNCQDKFSSTLMSFQVHQTSKG